MLDHGWPKHGRGRAASGGQPDPRDHVEDGDDGPNVGHPLRRKSWRPRSWAVLQRAGEPRRGRAWLADELRLAAGYAQGGGFWGGMGGGMTGGDVSRLRGLTCRGLACVGFPGLGFSCRKFRGSALHRRPHPHFGCRAAWSSSAAGARLCRNAPLVRRFATAGKRLMCQSGTDDGMPPRPVRTLADRCGFHAGGTSVGTAGAQSLMRDRRRALPMTLTEDSDMAAAATMGESSAPSQG